MQGPIDDAFTAPFLCVRGTGTAWNPAVQAWAEASLKRFAYEWSRYFRGELPVKDDTAVTAEDVRRFNLILFGDPGSNSLDRPGAPAAAGPLDARGAARSATRGSPRPTTRRCLIQPNPLAEGRYVVLNSGHTFHEKELATLNYLLFPRLGDWAVVKVGDEVPTTRPGRWRKRSSAPASSTSSGAVAEQADGRRRSTSDSRRSSARPPGSPTILGAYRSPLKFRDGSPVRNADDWAGAARRSSRPGTSSWAPGRRSSRSRRIEYLEKERRDGLTQHHVRLEVAPGRTTDDAYLLVPDGKGPFPAVLVVFYEAETGIGRGKPERLDFALQLARRGFVTLSLGSDPAASYPDKEKPQLQPLSFHAYVAANCYNALANLPQVDPKRIGVVGHSYGGKWAMFASCLYDKFACGVWSDPGIVFDEARPNVNYWEPWYLGCEPGRTRKPGIPTEENPRTGAYKQLVEAGHDLHELHALMAPRPFLVSGGSEDPPERWKALNHAVAVNQLLGYEDRVAMTNRDGHTPDRRVERADLPVPRARPETRQGGTGGRAAAREDDHDASSSPRSRPRPLWPR